MGAKLNFLAAKVHSQFSWRTEKENFAPSLLRCLIPAVNPANAPDARSQMPNPAYRGRLAPSPTGCCISAMRGRSGWRRNGRGRTAASLILRNEDIDSTRFKLEFVPQMIEDLRWFGFEWQEGPDCGGPFAPYNQSERFHLYRAALEKLRAGGFIYPCTCSRKDIRDAASAPARGR